MSHFFLGQAYSEQGMSNEAIREFEASADRNGHSPESVAILGCEYARAGQPEKAIKILEDLRQTAHSVYVSPVLYAQLVLALGEKNEALDYLDQARSVRAADLVWLKVRPAFDDLRGEPRFSQLCEEIGLSS
jgi:tetratricopeptide (TPR) repeat protein